MKRGRASIIGLYNLFRKYNRFIKNIKNIKVEIVLQFSRGKRDSEALKTKGTYRFWWADCKIDLPPAYKRCVRPTRIRRGDDSKNNARWRRFSSSPGARGDQQGTYVRILSALGLLPGEDGGRAAADDNAARSLPYN